MASPFHEFVNHMFRGFINFIAQAAALNMHALNEERGSGLRGDAFEPVGAGGHALGRR